ncbi:unnamed protein product, partial [Prorocentrum cordatum]
APLEDVTIFNETARGNAPVRIGGDCSGWCTEHAASLAALSVGLIHVFASDSCKAARKFIHRFCRPLHLCNDVTTRAAPNNLDLYVAGSPCQPWSIAAGNGEGLSDKRGRGGIVEYIVDYIDRARPKSFLLESAPGLATKFVSVFDLVIGALRALKDSTTGKAAYAVYWKILKPDVEGGLPQHRPRAYVAGILQTEMRRQCQWPTPIDTAALSQILEEHTGTWADLEQLSATKKTNVIKCLAKTCDDGALPQDIDAIFDMGGTKPTIMKEVRPCLTATLCQDQAYFSSQQFRTLTITDMMRLQGVDENMFAAWGEILSPRQMGSLIGDAMCQSIVERVLRGIYLSLVSCK